MRWKLFTLIAALMLATTLASPNIVAAEDLVEKTRTLVVAGIGTEQKLELYSYTDGGIYTIIVTVIDDDTANGTCTETVQATVKKGPRLKIIRIQMGAGNESLLITGEDAVPLDPTCFNNTTKRVAFQVFALPPGKAKQLASAPNTIPAEPQANFLNEMWGYSIVDSNEATVASASNYSLVVTRNADFDLLDP
jgi:hypothetical protein